MHHSVGALGERRLDLPLGLHRDRRVLRVDVQDVGVSRLRVTNTCCALVRAAEVLGA